MDEKLREKMRSFLSECYGVDIEQAVCKYSTQNYAFIFPDQPYMIRVSMTPKKTRSEIMSELMWVDDLKLFKQTICEPETSSHNRIMEEFVIDGITYRASMFRTARGNVQAIPEITPMFFICVGELLGSIHKVSANQQNLNMKYRRKSLMDDLSESKEKAWDQLNPKIQEKISALEEKMKSLPKDPETYGLCHGDFHLNNFFVEANNIWLFDFDGCLYAHYLYDIATFMTDCLQKGYKRGEDCRKTIFEDIMPYFKIGYCLNKECGENYWDSLELFIEYRIIKTVMALQGIKKVGVVDNLAEIKQYYEGVASADNCIDAMTKFSQG